MDLLLVVKDLIVNLKSVREKSSEIPALIFQHLVESAPTMGKRRVVALCNKNLN
jgi:hypothetical protein